jgi:hypothetical protein
MYAMSSNTSPVQHPKMLSPKRSFAVHSVYIETVTCATGDDTNLNTANPAALAMKTAVLCDVIR